MSYGIRSIGKKEDVIYEVQNSQYLPDGQKAAILENLKSFEPNDYFNAVDVQCNGHIGGNTPNATLTINAIHIAPTAPTPPVELPDKISASAPATEAAPEIATAAPTDSASEKGTAEQAAS